MKALKVMWYNTQGNTIGLVKAENNEGETRYLIGVGHGNDEDTDAQHIADWGAKFDPIAGELILP